ncbi:MAG: SIMPL domain-containing protein [Anaerolineales bacterium]
MTSKLNLFFTIIVALMLVAVLVLQVNSAQLPGAAESSQSEQTPTSEITVTGEATASAPPDIAYVNIGVQASAATADGAVKDSNATMTAVTNAITGAGVSSQDIQTSTYSITPQYTSPKAQASAGQSSTAPASGGQTGTSGGSGDQASSGQTSSGQSSADQTSSGQTSSGQTSSGQTKSGQDSGGQTASEGTASGQAPQISGYTVTNTVQVTIRDLNKVGQILDQAVQAGANDVSGVTFAIENPSKLQADALGQAVSDAQNRATALAQSSGVQLDNVIDITQMTGSSPVPVIASAAQLANNTSVPIQPGLVEVHLQIQVSFAIH